MKKLSVLFIAIAAVFMLVGQAKAAPMYYTFSGTVSTIVTDDAGIIAGAGLSAGSGVTYTVIVDFGADGFATTNNGTVYTYPDNVTSDIFFTDYVSGDALQQKDGGYYNAPTDPAELNYGYDYFPSTDGTIFANTFDDLLEIYSSDMVSTWTVGSAVTGYNYAYDSTGAKSELYAALTLTSLSNTASVPEPSTLLLLGSGLVGLGLTGWRKRAKKA